MQNQNNVELEVPISVGELLDKITILRIKEEKIRDKDKLTNIRNELSALEGTLANKVPRLSSQDKELFENLRQVNLQLWVIEDEIRECERNSDFGENFVRLARAVYHTNDERARLKRELNISLGSAYVEEKSYAPYSA